MHIHAVLPTYNRGHLLIRSVDSFLAAEPPDGVPTEDSRCRVSARAPPTDTSCYGQAAQRSTLCCNSYQGPHITMPDKSSVQILNAFVPNRGGALSDHVGIARPDHWIKNIFMLPGIAAAFAVAHGTSWTIGSNLALGLVSVCLVASANYTINEFLDSEFDRFHPIKSQRAGAKGLLKGRWVMVQYALLCLVGLSMAWAVNLPFFITSVVLLGMGVA